ncbi:S1 family peptidase [Streptomyces apricus]|uniref:Trypsin-like serine protease n=1 Tax=Streptomyces apricus TaxID=1828112 RepID=A0A5B0B028_9ACTN|nr:S1 family peptidase [Streptomyces apricus]KAA0935394.1 trypsin-like serine protease [Streptomyces apricus]
MRRSRTFLTTCAAAVTAVLALLCGPAPAAAAPRVPTILGGTVLYGSDGTQCVVAFNATGGGSRYAVTAGHCAGTPVPGTPTTWFADASRTVQVGVSVGASFPVDDYGVIRYTTSALNLPGEVALGGGAVQDVTGSTGPVVGQQVCHVGRTSGLHCGRVTAVNVTVNFAEGAVHGLFRSTACTEAGDSGGPAFSGTLAVGFVVGGSGNCASGGVTYYQPVAEVLARFGLSVY